MGTTSTMMTFLTFWHLKTSDIYSNLASNPRNLIANFHVYFFFYIFLLPKSLKSGGFYPFPPKHWKLNPVYSPSRWRLLWAVFPFPAPYTLKHFSIFKCVCVVGGCECMYTYLHVYVYIHVGSLAHVHMSMIQGWGQESSWMALLCSSVRQGLRETQSLPIQFV